MRADLVRRLVALENKMPVKPVRVMITILEDVDLSLEWKPFKEVEFVKYEGKVYPYANTDEIFEISAENPIIVYQCNEDGSRVDISSNQHTGQRVEEL